MSNNKAVKFILAFMTGIFLLLPLQFFVSYAQISKQVSVVPAANVAYAVGADGKCADGKEPSIDVGGTKKCAEDLTAEDKQNAEKEACRAEGHGLTWLICSVINVMQNAINKLEEFILGLLFTRPLNVNFSIFPSNGGPPTTSDPGQVILVFWANVRNVANIFLVVIFLVMIIGNAISIGVDSYTVKRTLPRLVMAAIFIQFSYLFCSIAVDVTNILGVGIINFMWTVIGGVNFGQNLAFGTGSVVGVGAAIGTVALVSSISSGGAAIIILGALIAVLGTLITLALRQVLIIVLVILSPLAFLAWVLPNTENLFKTWGKNFLKTLLMFPLIALIFGASRFGALLAFSSGNTGQQVVGILLMIAPLFAIPFTFKWAGGALAFGAGAVTGYAAGQAKKAQESDIAQGYKGRRQQQNLLALNDQNAGFFRRSGARAAVYGTGGVLGAGLNRGTRGRVGRGAAETRRRTTEAAAEKARQERTAEDAAQISRGMTELSNITIDPNNPGAIDTSAAAIYGERRGRQVARVIHDRITEAQGRGVEIRSSYDLNAYELSRVARGEGSELLGFNAGEDQIAQAAAITALSTRGDYGVIRDQVQNQIGAPGSVVTTATLNNGLAPNIADAMAKAPDVAKGALQPAFDNASYDKIAQFDQTTMQRYVSYIAENIQNGTMNVNSQPVQNLHRFIDQYNNDAQFRSRVGDRRIVNHVNDYVAATRTGNLNDAVHNVNLPTPGVRNAYNAAGVRLNPIP